MNYDANDFSSVWTKVVLLTIKSEMNLLRSRNAAAIKNQIIRGNVIHIVGCLQLIDKQIACLSHNKCG
jgi:hypothetical protein